MLAGTSLGRCFSVHFWLAVPRLLNQTWLGLGLAVLFCLHFLGALKPPPPRETLLCKTSGSPLPSIAEGTEDQRGDASCYVAHLLGRNLDEDPVQPPPTSPSCPLAPTLGLKTSNEL